MSDARRRAGRPSLFGPPPMESGTPANDGRRALFSAPRRTKGTVVVECSRCQARTPLPLARLVGRLVPSLWWPGRPYSRLLRCPGCGSIAWCRVHWRTLSG